MQVEQLAVLHQVHSLEMRPLQVATQMLIVQLDMQQFQILMKAMTLSVAMTTSGKNGELAMRRIKLVLVMRAEKHLTLILMSVQKDLLVVLQHLKETKIIPFSVVTPRQIARPCLDKSQEGLLISHSTLFAVPLVSSPPPLLQ